MGKGSGFSDSIASKNKGIGIFDSGIGGLTVLREIRKFLPYEDLFYLGDTARVPYGNRSKDTIIKYSVQNTHFLIGMGIKLLVIACNTSSSVAISALRHKFPELPIIGVIEPGSEQAVNATKTGKVGVIGTRATISSGSYRSALHRFDHGIKVFQQACPLFVPLVEEGMHRTKFANDIARHYLLNLKKHNIDTLILGCTHYPLLSPVIQKIVGSKVRLINSGQAVAIKVYEYLSEFNLLKAQDNSSDPSFDSVPTFFAKGDIHLSRFPKSRRGRFITHDQVRGSMKFFVTDAPLQFKKIGKLLLSHDIGNNIRKVVLEDYE